MKRTFLLVTILATSVSFAIYAGNLDDNNPIKKPFSLIAEGGNKDNKFSIGLAAGITIPLGGFAASGAASDSMHVNGSAQTGIHFNATVGYKIYKVIGAMVMVGGNINSCNPPTVYISGLSYTPVPSGPFYVGQYMAGPYVSIPIGKKFFIEARALAGLMTSSFPDIKASLSVSGLLGISASKDTKYKSGNAFGYCGGVGAKYMLGNHFGIMLNVAYSGSNMKYPSYTVHTLETSSSILSIFSSSVPTIPSINTTTTHNGPIHMSIGMINISAGVAFSF